MFIGPAREVRHVDNITYYGTWALYFTSEMYTHTLDVYGSNGGCREDEFTVEGEEAMITSGTPLPRPFILPHALV